MVALAQNRQLLFQLFFCFSLFKFPPFELVFVPPGSSARRHRVFSGLFPLDAPVRSTPDSKIRGFVSAVDQLVGSAVCRVGSACRLHMARFGGQPVQSTLFVLL